MLLGNGLKEWVSLVEEVQWFIQFRMWKTLLRYNFFQLEIFFDVSENKLNANQHIQSAHAGMPAKKCQFKKCVIRIYSFHELQSAFRDRHLIQDFRVIQR